MMPRASRLLPWFAVSTAAVALVWALAGLHAVFRAEQTEAHAASAAQRRALEEYAAQTLRETLTGQLRAARVVIAHAETDPLADDRDLFLQRGGAQILPRTQRPLAGDASPASALHARLTLDPRRVEAEAGSPWADRLARLQAVRRVLDGGDDRALEREVRGILRQRARYRIAAPLDLPYMLGLLELLSGRSHPDPALLSRVLRDGFAAEPVAVPGLQSELLDARDRFSQTDLLFLTNRISKLSEAASVRHDDFLDRALAPPGSRVPVEPEERRPYVSAGGGWYIEPHRSRAVGIHIDLTEQIAAVHERMRARHLLFPEDRMELAPPGEKGLPLAALLPRVESQRWDDARASADYRYRLKSSLGLLSGLLSFAILALALLAHERRRRLIAQRTEFVAAVSHELRTPLASIRLQAETLARRLAGRSEARDYPQRIVRDVDGLHFLVENILSYNRLERGGWRPQRSAVPLRALLLQLQQDLEGQTPRKLEIGLEADAAGVTLHADADLMRVLFANLLRNAAQYSERDPVLVRIACESGPKRQRIRVSDSGPGVPPALHERIFDDFFRSNPASPVRGSGLGLAICRRIARAHGGRIRVAASSPLGTTFEIDLPAARHEETA